MNNGVFRFDGKVKAKVPDYLSREIVNNIWHNFAFTQSALDIEDTKDDIIMIGDGDGVSLPNGAEYAIKVTKNGASVVAKDKSSLMRGFFDLVMKIEADEESLSGFVIREGLWRDGFTVKTRMVHICVFKQHSLSYIKKTLRLVACLGYTHAVIEFWGTYRFECMPELSWPDAFTQSEVKALAEEARQLGVEPIPMVNHLGHAASARENCGKHSALDQNPTLHRLFMPDGWAWNIRSEKVWELLQKMRNELYSVFGEGEYFHAGLDEAYIFSKTEENTELMISYLEKVTKRIVEEGRRPLVWADMLLPRESGNKHHGACKDVATSRRMLSSLDKKTVLVDWEYNVTEFPVSTAVYASGNGFDVIGAPWYNTRNISAYVNTAKAGYVSGVMITTWHTLAKYPHSLLWAAREMGCPVANWSSVSTLKHETATLLRKLNFEGFDSYEESGFARDEISLSVGEAY